MRVRVSALVSPRTLLSMGLLLGMLGGQAGNGTLAYFTSSVTSADNAFTAGTVDLTNSSLLTPTSASFSWTTAAGGSNCSNTLTGTDITTQRMQPGHYCVAPITIKNNSASAVDAWMRMRLVRQTATDRAALAAPSSLTVTTSALGGSLSGGTAYQYRVTATATDVSPAAVETTYAATTAVTTGSTTATNSNTLTWPRVSRATGYKIYRSTDSFVSVSKLIGTLTDGTVVTFVDIGDAGTTATAPASSPTCATASTTTGCVAGPNDELNSRLRLYVSEYTGGPTEQFTDAVLNGTTTLTSATAAFVSSDVGLPIVGTGIPGGTTIASVTDGTTIALSVAATASTSNVTINIARKDKARSAAQTSNCTAANFAPSATTSAATIANSTTLSDSYGGTTVSRTALTSVSANGKQLGRAFVPATGVSSNLNAIAAATVSSTASIYQAFAILAGVGSAPPFTESAMLTTAGETANAVNLVGNDTLTSVTSAGGNALSTGATGVAEAELVNTFGLTAPAGAAKAIRYYCAAVFFPSNSTLLGATGQPDLTSTSGDNLAATGTNTYSLVVTAAQKAGR